MNLPGLHLHQFKGDRRGTWAVSDTARALGVSRKTLSGILSGHVGISPEMAVRLSLAFETMAESWLNQQIQYDLWRVEKKRRTLRVKRLSAAA